MPSDAGQVLAALAASMAQGTPPAVPDFVMADLVCVNEFSYGADGRILYGFDHFMTLGMETTQDYVDVIDAVREQIDSSPLKGKVFPAGSLFTFWEIYRML